MTPRTAAQEPITATTELKWCLSLLSNKWGAQAAAVLLLLTSSLLWTVDPWILKWLIDRVIPLRHWRSLIVAAGLFLGVYFGRFVSLGTSLYLSTLTAQRITLNLRRRLTTILQRSSASFYDTHAVGDLVYHVEQDVDQVGALDADIFPSLMRISVSAVLTLAMMLALNWQLTCEIVLFVPAFVSIGVVFRRILTNAGSRTRGAAAARASMLTEALTGAIQVQLLGAIRTVGRRYGRLALDAMRSSLAERKSQVTYSVLSLSTIAVASTVMLITGGYWVITGALSIGGYVAFYTYLLRLFEPLNSAVDMHSRLQKGRVSIRRIMDLERTEKRTDMERGERSRAALRTAETLKCDGLRFQYPSGRTVLTGPGVHVSRGERVALIGPSGTGKSTMLKLIARVHEPTGGRITLDGVDIRDISLDILRRIIGFVPQDPVLFEGTILENLLLGNRAATDVDIKNVLRVACLDGVVETLPGGLNYHLGPFGAGLSGGEKQRLAVARVLLRDPSMLVLDEVTSALDANVKSTFLRRLADYAGHKAVLIAGHDALIVRWADRVIDFAQTCRTLPKTRAGHGGRVSAFP
jgi:ABC-type bacteriocin/lantibiotic exporter with double-glycine peptidase domain